MKATYSQAAICLFCEDVRLEASGQVSLIGMFPSRIGVPSFPVKIPKFTIYSMIRCELKKPPKSITLKVTYPWSDEPYLADGPTTQWIQEEMEEAIENEDSALFFTLHLPITEFDVKSSGKIRAFVIIDGKEHKAGSLNFKEMSNRKS